VSASRYLNSRRFSAGGFLFPGARWAYLRGRGLITCCSQIAVHYAPHGSVLDLHRCYVADRDEHSFAVCALVNREVSS